MTPRVPSSFLEALPKKRDVIVERVGGGKARSSAQEQWAAATQGKFSLDAGRRGRGRFDKSEVSQRTIGEEVFDSKLEANRYRELLCLQRVGQVSGLSLQPSWDIEINGIRVARYTADFSYFDHVLNRIVIEDVKSTGTEKDPYYRLRKRLAEAAHGIRVDEVVR